MDRKLIPITGSGRRRQEWLKPVTWRSLKEKPENGTDLVVLSRDGSIHRFTWEPGCHFIGSDLSWATWADFARVLPEGGFRCG